MTNSTQRHEQILAEEAELKVSSFSLDETWRLGVTMRDAAGAVGVSGLPQLEDHAFVVEQLRAFLAAS